MFRLEELGWHDFFASQVTQYDQDGMVPARIAEENHEIYRVFSEQGEARAELAGKLRHEAGSRADLPGVGDWVLVREHTAGQRTVIHRVLPRRTKFSRKTAGKKTEEQIVAANVDTILLVTSLQQEFNLRRIERYLSLAWESGARPVVIVNKCDLCEESTVQGTKSEVAGLGVRVVATSAVTGEGVSQLREMIRSDTAALIGSSGVGKSSLINAILGEEKQHTNEVRSSDGKGRHTTTTRQMILVPGGGILIDTPGMRELQLWDAGAGLEQTFADIQTLAQECRFRDCRHESEPGCAVCSAAAEGAIAEERLASYHKLEKEERFIEAKQDAAVRAARTKELKRLLKDVNRFYRDRGR